MAKGHLKSVIDPILRDRSTEKEKKRKDDVMENLSSVSQAERDVERGGRHRGPRPQRKLVAAVKTE